MGEISQLILKRKEKAHELKKMHVPLYPNTFRVKNSVKEIIERFGDKKTEDLEDSQELLITAGRIMTIRDFGKATFIHFQDGTGRLQAYIKRDDVGKDVYKIFKKLDIGDIVGLKGHMFRTKTGELTLLAKELQLLTKSLRPLPEKFHGLTDIELRYRQRYLDLVMNAKTREVFKKRIELIAGIKQFLQNEGFLEVETPMMQPIPGGAIARPFRTHHHALGMDLYLRIAPELYLKRLVIGGFEKIFEINRSFRNEGLSSEHNPEFTMLEFYQAYATYEDLMELTERLLTSVAQQLLGTLNISYQGNNIDLTPPWRRYGFNEALIKLGGVDPSVLRDASQALSLAESLGVHVKGGRLGKILTKLFDALVESKLVQPTFITGYPVETSPLARRNDENPEITDRFELFIGGKEIANGFSELNNPIEQKERFLEQLKCQELVDEEAIFMDDDFIKALEYGMPPTAGEGIGIDRVVMVFTDSPSIRDVILFPQLKLER